MDKKGRVTKFKPCELPELLDSHWLELARVAPHLLYLQITFSSIFLGSKQKGMKQNYNGQRVWARGNRLTFSMTGCSSFLTSLFLEAALREYVALILSLVVMRFTSAGTLELKFTLRSPQVHLLEKKSQCLTSTDVESRHSKLNDSCDNESRYEITMDRHPLALMDTSSLT
jgi:hypothetical protein